MTTPGSVAHGIAGELGPDGLIRLEHPSGHFDVVVDDAGPSIVSTARRLFDGITWPGPSRTTGG